MKTWLYSSFEYIEVISYISSRFSSNSESFASLLLVNHEELFPRQCCVRVCIMNKWLCGKISPNSPVSKELTLSKVSFEANASES